MFLTRGGRQELNNFPFSQKYIQDNPTFFFRSDKKLSFLFHKKNAIVDDFRESEARQREAKGDIMHRKNNLPRNHFLLSH